MHVTDLGGHSGCRILLCETEDNSVYVRKISGNLNYNKRLVIQAEKQKAFVNGTVMAPDVLDSGYTEEGLFYFDMEYIQGITLAEYMKTIEIGKVRGLVETIVKKVVIPEAIEGDVDESAFHNKIDMLEKKLIPWNNEIVDQALKILRNHSWRRFVKTACHGDFTLENIIVKDNRLYLIDFLDSFYDSWIMDISTLLQDVQTLWSYRMEEQININTLLRLIVFRDILIDEVRRSWGDHINEIYYALLFKLIRIYPYIKDRKTYDFLNEKTQSVIRIIGEESQ